MDIERPRHLQNHIDENKKQSDKSSCKTSKRVKSSAPNREATTKPKQKPVKSVKKPEQIQKEKLVTIENMKPFNRQGIQGIFTSLKLNLADPIHNFK